MKMLVIGTCQMDAIVSAARYDGYEADHFLFGFKPFEDLSSTSIEWENYDVYFIGASLRYIMAEISGSNNELIFWRLSAPERAEFTERFVNYVANKLRLLISTFGTKPTVFVGFIEPSSVSAGNVFRYDPELDFKEFVHILNIRLKTAISDVKNCYFLDPNPILDKIGRRTAQSDVLQASTHASFVGDWDFDTDAHRTVRPIRPGDIFNPGDTPLQYGRGVIEETSLILKAISNENKIKLIIVDLDDTLWRGIAAEDDFSLDMRLEGWPLGFIEALLVFKRRGGLLAIASKNTYDETAARFHRICGTIITLDDFASVKISWDRKSESIAEILKETNILQENAVFIDDNPRELDEVKGEFPKINIITSNHYLWRQTILQSPSFLTAHISAESKKRTEMIRAKIERDESSQVNNKHDWLLSLDIKQTITKITSASDQHFPRAFELINKTNQFNTNGKRWDNGNMVALFREGGYLITSHISDNKTDNGLTGVVIIRGDEILQAVLSCRVFGLGAEDGMLSAASQSVLEQHDTVRASVEPTGKNFVCLDVFQRLGFERIDDRFVISHPPATPDWIHITWSSATEIPES